MLNDYAVIDLFSGCGGFTLGFQNAGFEVVAAFDNWQPAVDVYRANFKKHKVYKQDIQKVDKVVRTVYSGILKGKEPIIIGGPPCQDFYAKLGDPAWVARKRAENDSKRAKAAAE